MPRPPSPRCRIAMRLEAPAPGRPAADLEELCRRAVGAEEAGVEILWLMDPGEGALALHLAVAIAARTGTLRIGAEIRGEPLHPLRIAEDAASADGITGGRLELGFGGALAHDSHRLTETIEILRGAWTPGAVVAEAPGAGVAGAPGAVVAGERGGGETAASESPTGADPSRERLRALEVHPKPSHPDGPPLWLAEGEPACAAACGIGYIGAARSDVLAYLEAWRDRGRDPAAARAAVGVVAATGTASAALSLEAVRERHREEGRALGELAELDWIVPHPPAPGSL